MNIRKITEEEVRSLWVQRLPDTPNRTGRFGTPGMSASEIKAAYDALALRIVERYNELVEAVLAGEVASTLPTGNGEDTLEDFFADVRSGALATYLTVDGERALSTLAAAFDCHDHDGEYAPLVNGKLSASLLPDKYESVFAEAEAERAAAEAERIAEEAERSAAEARREALVEAFCELMATMEAGEAERNRVVAEAMRAAEEAEAASREASVGTVRLAREIANLKKAAEGALYENLEDASHLYRKPIPRGSLPFAAVASIGGGYSGATALSIPDGLSLTNAAGEICGYTEGGVLCQTAHPGIGARWQGIGLLLEGEVFYTVGFDIYVDPAIPANDYLDFTFGITRDQKMLLSISVACPQHGVWVRRSVTFRAPSRLTEDGYLPLTGELFLGYTGACDYPGDGIRFRNVSVAHGKADVYIPRERGRGVSTTAAVSHGANLIPFPYPAYRPYVHGVSVAVLEDGSLLLNGVAQVNISYNLYTNAHDLSLPEGEIYVHGKVANGVTLVLKPSLNERLSTKAVLSHEDEYRDHYYLYLYIRQGTVFENTRILPFVSRGKAMEPCVYRAPIRYEIPEEVRALPGYGIAGNRLDLAEGVYRQTVNDAGETLPDEAIFPLPGDFVNGCILPVDEGGYITLENAEREGVDSTIIYEIKTT